MIHLLQQWFCKKRSLKGILIVPLVIQIFFIGSLIVLLSYITGESSISKITDNLRSEVTNRIADHFSSFLTVPHQINRTNANLLASNLINPQDINTTQQVFLNEVKNFDSISSIYFGNVYGGIIGSGREGSLGSYYVYYTQNAQPGKFLKYTVDLQGIPDQLQVSIDNFDARTRPWYSSAIHRKTNTWSEIYFLVTGQDMAIAASQPVYDQNKNLLGVVSVDIFISQLSDFIQNIKISEHGIAYVIERSGEIVVASSPDVTVQNINNDGSYSRIKAKDSSSIIIAESAAYLNRKYGDFINIDQTQQSEISINQERYFLQVTPFQDGYGVDWMIVVVVPEADFVGQIRQNTVITGLLIVTAIVITIIFNIFLVRRINQPVKQLSQYTHLVGNERWEGIKSLNSWILEIDSLGESFMKMGEKLRILLQNLKDEIEERKIIETNLRESEDRYRALLENIPTGVFRTSLEGNILAANNIIFEMFGYEFNQRDQFTNILSHYIYQETRQEILTLIKQNGFIKNYEVEFVKVNGEPFWGSITTKLIKDDQGMPILDSIIEDITDRKLANDKLQYIATHDHLTKMPNRVLFEDRLHHAIDLANRNKNMVAVLIIDLDNFKMVNDAFGHKNGDRLLSLIGKRILSCLRCSDTVSRFGGDEFTVILEGIKQPEDSILIIEKILTAVSEPVILNNAEVFVTCSIGVSTYPADGQTVDELIQNADHSLYVVKDDGKNSFQFYSSEMKEEVLKRLELKNYLRKALEKNELELYYQPLINIQTQTIFGAEALLRWHHPELGFLMPGSFINLAEETGLIIPIGEWVVQQTCQQLKTWINEGLELSRISVNISHRQLKSAGFIEMLQNALNKSGLPPQFLELELNENILFKDSDIESLVLSEIRNLGVRLAIDDFGTGFTSLSRLTSFEFQTLKIDRCFTGNIHSAKDASVIQGILLIAKKLGMDIIVEGVETIDQVEFFRDLKCFNFQGWLYSKALTKTEFKNFVQQFNHKKNQ